MIKQIKGVISFTDAEKNYIKSLGELNGNMWKCNDEEMEELKSNIRERLCELQGLRCAYCGFKLGVTSNEEIEHIAPKGKIGKRVLYPKFMFTEKNLVLSCHYCNGFSKKGTFDTIETYCDEYEKCTFKIVHPYFDDPEQHYEFTSGVRCILIKIKNNSKKAEKSIKIFKLDSIQHSEERAKEYINEYLNNTMPINEYEKLLERSMLYK
jgi:uncharacterized protein (TIGR02646 family)